MCILSDFQIGNWILSWIVRVCQSVRYFYLPASEVSCWGVIFGFPWWFYWYFSQIAHQNTAACWSSEHSLRCRVQIQIFIRKIRRFFGVQTPYSLECSYCLTVGWIRSSESVEYRWSMCRLFTLAVCGCLSPLFYSAERSFGLAAWFSWA